jgi:hypothetical protein
MNFFLASIAQSGKPNHRKRKKEKPKMAAKKYFVTIDTETTQDGKVADIGIVVSDRKGNIHHEAGILIGDFFSDRETHPLFHVYGDKNDIFSAASLPKRYAAYEQMLQDGRRVLASVGAVNRFLSKVKAKYNPTLTAYNLAFDSNVMDNSGIIANELFPESFCLWHASVAKWGNTKAFKQFALENHFFGNRTNKTGHMGIKTNADVMAKYLLGVGLPDEPHTALEDAKFYEVPILTALVKNTSPKEYMSPPPYNYRAFAVRDHFKVK